jgi:hypothetical protein
MNEEKAFKCEAVPCNPIPFANRIVELVKGNTGNVQSDEVKACLWILNSQAYGQLATIDLCDEWDRLNKSIL